MQQFEWNGLEAGDPVLVHDTRNADLALTPGRVAHVDRRRSGNGVGIRVARDGETTVHWPLPAAVHRDPRDPTEPCWRCAELAGAIATRSRHRQASHHAPLRVPLVSAIAGSPPARRKVDPDVDGAPKNELLSRTSHELRTPLNAILGFAQILEMTHGDDPEIAEPVGHIRRAGDHLVALIDDVLDIARVEARDLHLTTETISAQELVDNGIRLIAPLAAARDITIVVDTDCAAAPPLLADRKRALQVLLSLLSNATKYNVKGGAITVACTPAEEGHLAISVTDTGPGLDHDQIARLFTPFERLGAERTDTEGTGIGLTLSRALAHHMGGSLTATSVVGHGSTFTFELPTHAAPAPSPT